MAGYPDSSAGAKLPFRILAVLAVLGVILFVLIGFPLALIIVGAAAVVGAFAIMGSRNSQISTHR